MAYFSGQYHTFDGALYIFHGIGEYTLMTGVINGLTVTAHVRQGVIASSIMGTGIDGFALAVGNSIVEIYAGLNDDDIKGSAYVNGTVIGFIDRQQYSAFTYIKNAVDQASLFVGEGTESETEFRITVNGRFLTVNIYAGADMTDIRGLLGDGDNNVYNDFMLRDGTEMDGEAGGDLNQNAIQEVFANSWEAIDTLFTIYPTADVRPAGTALLFDSTHAVSPVLQTWVDDGPITIEFHFKFTSDLVDCGTLFSYKFTVNGSEEVTTLAVCSDGSIKYIFNNDSSQDITISVSLSADSWYHIFIVADPVLNYYVQTVYDVEANTLITRVVRPVQSYYTFTSGGTLMFGQWNAPEGLTYGLNLNFVGYLDEIRIWNRGVDPENYKYSYTDPTTEDLVHYWRFNDGVGNKAEDITSSGSDLTFLSEPWRVPEWTKSTTTVNIETANLMQTYTALQTADSVELLEYSEFCTCSLAEMLSVESGCANMGDALLNHMHEACVFNALLFKDTAHSLDVILAFGSQCEFINSPDNFVPQGLCNSFPGRYFPFYMGESCEQLCTSGKRDVPDACICYEGFYGEECDMICPSANNLPCGSGSCDKLAGSCTCPGNFDPSTNCADCRSGWHGADCSIALSNSLESSSSERFCLVFAKSHFINFKGMTFDMEVTGEFKLLEASEWTIYIRQIPCGNYGATCINQILIVQPGNTDKVAIHGVYPIGDTPYVFIGGTESNFTSSLTVDGIRLEWTSPTKMKIQHIAANHEIHVSAIDRFLNVEIAMASGCTSWEGICSNCNSDQDFEVGANDFVLISNVDTQILKGNFALYHRATEDIGFIYDVTIADEDTSSSTIESSADTDGGSNCASGNATYINFVEPYVMNTLSSYMLKLKRSVLQGSSLTNSFDLSKDVTIEIKINEDSESVGGVIWSYVKEDHPRVSLSNANESLSLLVDNQLIGQCPFTTETDEWNHVSMVYNRDSGNTTLFLFYTKDSADECSFENYANLFPSGGTFSLGGELPFSGEETIIPRPTVVAAIDEVRIWKRVFDKYIIMQNTEFDVTGFPDLATYWKLSEGSGDKSLDSVNNDVIILPRDGSVTWFVSTIVIEEPPTITSSDPYEFYEVFDYNYGIWNNNPTCNYLSTRSEEYISNYEIIFDSEDTVADQDENIYCEDIFSDEIIINSSTAIGNGVRQFFILTCEDDMANSVDDAKENALGAVVEMFLRYSTSVDTPVTNATASLCEAHDKIEEQTMCLQNEFCRFGEYRNGVCTCLDGYWGTDCSGICPLGPKETCGCNGECNIQTGECICPPTFTADSNCTECRDGFTGSDCLTEDNNSGVPDGDATCSVYGLGRFNNFMSDKNILVSSSNTAFSLVKPNTSMSENFEIQVRTTTCYYSSVCITAAAFKKDSDIIIIRAPYSTSSPILIWINGELIGNETNLMSSSETIGTLTLEQTSCYGFRVTESVSGFTATLRIWKLYIGSLTVNTPVEYCGLEDSICSCCGSDDCSIQSQNAMAVEEADSLFGPLFNTSDSAETREVNGAGSCLKLDNTIVSNRLPLLTAFIENVDITVKFYLKPVTNHGVLLSYGYTTSFTIFLNTTLHIQIEDVVYNTGFELTMNQWCQIAIVYQSENQIFTVYVQSGQTSPLYEAYTSSRSDIFASGGILTLGRYQPARETEIFEIDVDYFIGYIDELSVWHRVFPLAEIVSSYGVPVRSSETDLYGLWTFDEGDGVQVGSPFVDETLGVASYTFSTTDTTWLLSDAPIGFIASRASDTITDELLQSQAAVICENMVNSTDMRENCPSFTGRDRESFIYSCLGVVARTYDIQASLMVLQGLADMCSIRESHSDWPGQFRCGDFNEEYFPNWRGPNCNINCKCGTYDSSTSQCTCK